MLGAMSPAEDLHPTAALLLDAHVAWLVDRWTTGGGTGDLDGVLADDVDLLLDLLEGLTLTDVVDPDALVEVVGRVLATVPASERAAGISRSGARALLADPPQPFALADVVERAHVEALLRLALSRVDLLEAALDRAARSPQLARLAGGFVGRIVADVLAANRAVAEKIPGVGSLVSLGARAGGRLKGAADAQLDALLGDTAGKGATLAMRRLTKVLADTLRDPGMVDALMEVHDLFADQPLPGPDELAAAGIDPADLDRVVDLLHEVVAAAAPTQPVLEVVASILRGVLADHGDVPVPVLLDELGLSRDELVVHVLVLAPRALAAAHESGRLEDALRAHLAPFYASPGATAILRSALPEG